MKQKSKAVLIVLSVILLLLIAGCKGKEDEKPKDFPFLGGTEGLEIKFLKDEPPNEITDGNIFPFKVVLSIKNEGEFDLKDTRQVKVNLKGILPADFSVSSIDIKDKTPQDPPTARKKDSEGNIREAVETFVSIPPGDKPLQLGTNKISANTEFLFRADVCYQYGTDAISKICILENMISIPDDAICNPRGDKKVFSSSSPVQVTGFRQSVAAQDKIQFSFDIVHVGKGKVFKPTLSTTTSPLCPTDLKSKREQENLVEVTVDTGLESGTLSCVGLKQGTAKLTGEVRLVDDKKTITCTQSLTFKTDLERNVDIKLRFDYLDILDKKVLAKHILEPVEPSVQPPISGIQLCTGTGTASRCIPRGTLQRCEDLDLCTTVPSNDCKCATTDKLACQGECKPRVGEEDKTPPEVGEIEPEFAVAGTSQLFVLQNVFDKDIGKRGSGVSRCDFIIDGVQTDPNDLTWFSGKSYEAGFQGPPNCRSDLHKCDFFKFIDIPRHQEARFEIKAICVNKDGHKPDTPPRAKTIKIKKPDSPQTPPPPDTMPPIVGVPEGKLLIDIATIDTSGKVAVLIFDQRVGTDLKITKGSGIGRCEISLPGHFRKDEDTDRAPITMEIIGPNPCLGEKDQEDTKDGTCIAQAFYDYDSKNRANKEILRAGKKLHKIVCTDRQNIKREIDVEITLCKKDNENCL